MDRSADLFELLTASPPNLSCGAAERIACERFGVSGSAKVLTSERDQNFFLKAEDGREFVLKIANPLEDPLVTDFQSRALLHVASRDPELPVPRMCTATNGALDTTVRIAQGQQCTVRLLTFLPGVPSDTVSSTPALRRNLGQHLARLGRALSDFSHPGSNHKILWDMKHAACLSELVPRIQDSEQRSCAARYVEDFKDRVPAIFADLRWQVIYNDLNLSNVFVDPDDRERIVGIIDFGDLILSPLIIDVAVAATYQLRLTVNPFEAAEQLIAAYHSLTPLEDRELDLLFDLMATRLAMSVIISTWRASLHPENRDYILRNAIPNWQILRQLDGSSRADVHRRLKAACQAIEC